MGSGWRGMGWDIISGQVDDKWATKKNVLSVCRALHHIHHLPPLPLSSTLAASTAVLTVVNVADSLSIKTVNTGDGIRPRLRTGAGMGIVGRIRWRYPRNRGYRTGRGIFGHEKGLDMWELVLLGVIIEAIVLCIVLWIGLRD